MNENLLLIVLLANFYLVACIRNYDSDVSSISNVLLDIADEFLSEENIAFDFTILKTNSPFIMDILNHLMSKINEKFSYKIKYMKAYIDVVIFQRYSTFMFFDSLDEFELIENQFQVFRHQSEAIKYFAFIPNLTFEQLKASGIYRYYT